MTQDDFVVPVPSSAFNVYINEATRDSQLLFFECIFFSLPFFHRAYIIFTDKSVEFKTVMLNTGK